MKKIGSAFRLLLCGFVLLALTSVVQAGGHKKLTTIALIPGLTNRCILHHDAQGR